MIFKETAIEGAWLLDLNQIVDERGFSGRVWCREEFKAHGITGNLSQSYLSWSRLKGTVRGMHFQRDPYSEMKAVRCIRGAVFDVVLDLRPDSQTYCQWHGEELSAENRRMFVVPEGCAHGCQSLTDDTEMLYLISQPHVEENSAGVRWDDPSFGIRWPLHVSEISPKDAAYPDINNK